MIIGSPLDLIVRAIWSYTAIALGVAACTVIIHRRHPHWNVPLAKVLGVTIPSALAAALVAAVAEFVVWLSTAALR